jgi:hypothetical protein
MHFSLIHRGSRAAFAFGLATAMVLGLRCGALAATAPVTVTIVDNLDSPVSSARVSQSQQKAQPFMTGDASYVVHAVELELAEAASLSQAVVNIRLDSGGLPGAALTTLDAVELTAGGLGTYVFEADPGMPATLEPNTKYWVVLENILGEVDWAVKTVSAPGILDEEADSNNGGSNWSSSNVPNRYYLMKVVGRLIPRVTIMNAQSNETDGASQMNFVVSLSGPPGEDATLLVTTSSGTATSGSDFTQLINQPFVFSAGGSTTQSVTVDITGDQLVEDDETFTISLSTPMPERLILDDTTATGTISDDDSALFDDFNDGNDNGWTHYNPLGTASFSAVSGGYRIQSGAVSPLPAKPVRAASGHQDLGNELDFALGVEVASWAAGLNQGFGLMGRTGPFRIVDFSGYAFLYFPGLAQAQIVRLDRELMTPLEVADVTLNPALDYWFSFSGTGDSLEGKIFQKDDLGTPLVTVNATDNRYLGGSSGVYVTAHPADRGSAVDVTFDNFLASAVIPPLLAVGTDTVSQPEGAGGSTVYDFEVTRGGAVDVTLSVDWAVGAGGAGVADVSDFVGGLPSGTVTFASGQTSMPILILVAGDGVVELDESFQLTLSGATSRAMILEGTAGGLIQNDDSANLDLGFGANALQVLEGRDGIRTAVTVLQLSAPVDLPVSVTISTGDFTATVAANDYVPRLSQVVTFAANETFLPVAIAVNGDRMAESEFEVFQVRVDAIDAGSRSVSLAQSITAISIVDDDLGVNISGGPIELSEGSGMSSLAFAYTVSLTAMQSSPTELNWSIVGTGANKTDASDFSAVSGMVTIPADTLSAPLIVPVSADFNLEPLESFDLTVGVPPAPATQSSGGGGGASSRRIALQGPGATATLGASGGLDGSGRILLPDGLAATDGFAITLVTIGVLADHALTLRQLQDGSALMNYQSMIASGQLVERSQFSVDSTSGHAGAFNGTSSVTPSAILERVFLFAFNAPMPADATAGGIFGRIESWFMPATADDQVSLDARVVGETYWGQLIPSASVPQTFDLRMAPLPGQPGLFDVVGSTVSGRIANDDEIDGIGQPDMSGGITISHVGLPNVMYDLQFSDDLITWATFENVMTDGSGMASYSQQLISKIGRRFYRFRLGAP